jgi:hypothetical protein
MAHLYAATGDGIARLEDAGEGWTVELFLSESGAQCLAVDPVDADTLYAGLREGGVGRTIDGGRSWVDCKLPESAVFSLAVSPADGAVYAAPPRCMRKNSPAASASAASTSAPYQARRRRACLRASSISASSRGVGPDSLGATGNVMR